MENTNNTENKETTESLIKKLIYQGIGIAAITKDKLQQAVDELIHTDKISSDEGKKFVEDISNNIDEKAKDTEKKIRDMVNDALARFRPASRAEVEDLKKRIEALEKLVASMD